MGSTVSTFHFSMTSSKGDESELKIDKFFSKNHFFLVLCVHKKYSSAQEDSVDVNIRAKF